MTKVRYEISNGRTLCVKCHRKTDTWGAGALKSLTNSQTAGG